MFRVIWQFEREPAFMLSGFKFESLVAASANVWSDVPLVDPPEPVFSRDPISLLGAVHALSSIGSNDRLMRMSAYFHAFTSDRAAAERMVARLREEPSVGYAAIQEQPVPPERLGNEQMELATDKIEFAAQQAKTKDLTQRQVYLRAAPDGVDARAAWQVKGGRGQGVRIVDIENGWNLQHEDLIEKLGGVIYGQASNHDHGTAVIGIFGGDANGFGVVGLAPDAVIYCAAATYDSAKKKWNAADAIRASADKLGAGDVILLEMHAPGPNAGQGFQQGYIPIEFWQPEFDAIRYATAKGIYVVEAAGNGGENLDDAAYHRLFDRNVRDSGAIVVGAGQSPFNANPRSRISWSNYGGRLDVQGWGYDIVTAGGKSNGYNDLVDHPDGSRCYTKSFGGTSGASPIVTGVVAIVSAIRQANGLPRLSPVQMRTLLATTGTAQTAAPGFPATQKIGPLPDLGAIIAGIAIA